MKWYHPALYTIMTLCAATAAAAEPPVSSAVDIPRLWQNLPYPPPATNGDTLLLELCRTASLAPETARNRLLHPLITSMLANGADALAENKAGCNAMFYISGTPQLLESLRTENLLPPELVIRIPYEENPLLRYIRTRNAQSQLATTPGSKDYFIRRYCTPAYTRAADLVQRYLSAESTRSIPRGALGEALNMMHLGNPSEAENYINQLPLWEHGEHFLEEIPALLLSTLHGMDWRVAPGQLRLALQKLATMLPTTKDDMIDCNAATPMSLLMEMLVRTEGKAALPDLRHYATVFDPGVVHAALIQQVKLQGAPLPWEQQGLPTQPTDDLTNALLADHHLRHANHPALTPDMLLRAAEYLRTHNMPEHATIMANMVENNHLITTPAALPTIAEHYSELKEQAPMVTLLRLLLQPTDTEEQQP